MIERRPCATRAQIEITRELGEDHRVHVLGAVVLLLTISSVARAQPVAEGAAETTLALADVAVGSRSTSIGLPTRGRLDRGVALEDSDVLFVKAGSESSRWGTAEAVGLVERAAASVLSRSRGARLMVGDLSGRAGGRTRPHRSHRTGRDIDLGFFLVDAAGDSVEPSAFVHLDREGRGRDRRGNAYRLDTARTWLLIEALLDDPVVRVQFILIAPHVRTRLLAHARDTAASASSIERFELVSTPRQGSASHRNHFHVRIYCAPDDRGRCIDEPPYHPFAFDEETAEIALSTWRDARPARVRRRSARRHSRQ